MTSPDEPGQTPRAAHHAPSRPSSLPPLWSTLRARLSVQGWVQLILAALVLVVCGCTLVAARAAVADERAHQ